MNKINVLLFSLLNLKKTPFTFWSQVSLFYQTKASFNGSYSLGGHFLQGVNLKKMTNSYHLIAFWLISNWKDKTYLKIWRDVEPYFKGKTALASFRLQLTLAIHRLLANVTVWYCCTRERKDVNFLKKYQPTSWKSGSGWNQKVTLARKFQTCCLQRVAAVVGNFGDKFWSYLCFIRIFPFLLQCTSSPLAHISDGYIILFSLLHYMLY